MSKSFVHLFILFQIYDYISNRIDKLEFNTSINIILFDHTCIYITEDDNIINKIDVEGNTPTIFGNFTNIKNKTLLKLSNDEFIIFGLNSNNLLLYNKSNINDNSGREKILKNINIPISNNIRNYSIKHIEKDTFLFYCINENDYFYLYSFNLDSRHSGGSKSILTEQNDLLNTIECDSFDGENIFCVYSLIENINDLSSTSFSTFSYYSFVNINNQELQKNEIKKNIAGPSLLKIKNNDKKKFLICYYENKQKNPSVYCQFFTQENNAVIIEKIFYIGTTQYQRINYFDYKFQNLIQLINYDNSIYIHSILESSAVSKISSLFIASLDLNLIIPYRFKSYLEEKKNVLVSDKYILFITSEKIEIVNLELKCPNTTLFQFYPENQNIDLSLLANNLNNQHTIYISFGLDPLTILNIDNKQNMGGLLYMYPIKENNIINSNIKLVYNDNLKITYNYYIYHSVDSSITTDLFPSYFTYSNFCLLKVLHCYKSCLNCSKDIIGIDEDHQCISCKPNYNKFYLNLSDTNYFNCYDSSNSLVQNNYYLENGTYQKCNESCLTCNNGKNCSQCHDGFYYKEDEYKRNNSNFPCYKNTPQEYFLDTNSNPKEYRRCYNTCSTCFAEGNPTNNSCIKCKDPYIKYAYDSTKCTIDFKNQSYKFWKIDEITKNVQGIDTCDDFIINEGDNANQCVKNCQSYLNPLSISTSDLLLSYSCGEYKYCITPYLCQIKRWKYNLTTCYSEKNDTTCFNVSDPTPAPTTILTTEILTTIIEEEEEEEKPEPIKGRAIIVKKFEFNDTYFSLKNFSGNQIDKYINELKIELISHEYLSGIDFITINNYEDFNITIYPLNKEEYLYKNVLKVNNLCFINFTKFFNEKNFTKENDKNIIMVGLIEFMNNNTPIKSTNYFFFEYNEETENGTEIQKEYLNNDTSIELLAEYPLYDFTFPNITERYSSKLISTIKALYKFDPELAFYNETNEFYTDICRTFTSEIGTDMTIYDRIQSYSTKISLCENGCKITDIIDKEEKDNPRSVCKCKYKTYLDREENYYNFIYDKVEGKNVSNFNVLKCAKNVFSGKEIQNNFVFWIFLFLILIIFIILLTIILCGKNSVEDILKIKKEIEPEESQSKDNSNNISVKVFSDNSDEKFQSLEVNEKKNNYKEIISSKISYAVPPKKKKDISSKKTERRLSSKTESSINTTINLNNKLELKFKNEEEIFDEIFPDYNEVLNNNYYNGKYMKNNYVKARLKSLKIKNYFMIPLSKEECINHNKTDSEDNLDDLNTFRNRRKKNTFNYFKTLLPKAELSKHILKDNYETIRWETEYDLKNKKNILKKSGKYFDDSDFLENGNKKNKHKKKNTTILDSDIGDKDNIFIHKKKKSLLSSDNSNIKKSDNSSARSISKNNSLDKYFLNSSISNINSKVKYKLYKFYWIYLNKREFCLTSLYNMEDNVASFIRISSFIFNISLFFTLNCLFLTYNQISERYSYVYKNGNINEFKYIFKKEFRTVILLAFIYLVIKMLFIKFIYGKIFKISYSAKEDLSPFGLDSEKDNKDDKNNKRNKYLNKYRKRSLIYIGIIFILMILLGYISICYFGIFINTKGGMVLRFVISFFFSIIFCIILCLIIVIIYHFGRKYDSRFLKYAFRILKIIY